MKAAGNSIGNPVFENSPLKGLLNSSDPNSFLGKFLPNLIGLAFVIGTVTFFFVLIVGAIQWITSGGEKASLESARSKITNALIGLILLLATFALIKVIQDFFSISILSLDINPLIIK